MRLYTYPSTISFSISLFSYALAISSNKRPCDTPSVIIWWKSLNNKISSEVLYILNLNNCSPLNENAFTSFLIMSSSLIESTSTISISSISVELSLYCFIAPSSWTILVLRYGCASITLIIDSLNFSASISWSNLTIAGIVYLISSGLCMHS